LQAEEQALNAKSTISQNPAAPAATDRQFAATNFQRTSIRLGSIRNGQLNYKSDQHYFEGHASD
jgi:hypothetical protein